MKFCVECATQHTGYSCRACTVNEYEAGQTLCDECEAQLEAELERRAIRSWNDLMEEWKRSVPDSYTNCVASIRTESFQDDERLKQHVESLGDLLAADPILYYAQLKMTEDYRRSLDARFGSSFAVSPRTATESSAISVTEPTPSATVTQEQSLRVPRVSSDYDIPAGYPANWHELRRTVYGRDNYTCQDCGGSDVRVVAHHVVPLWDGGGNEISNLVTLCEPCHDLRHALISAERRELRRQLRRSHFRWHSQTVAAAIIGVLMLAWFIAFLVLR
ncbi:MAG: HNH endonuclease [Dehalococcoidia bacterium]